MNLLTDKKIILASSSPRRLDLLRQAGVEPEIFPVQVQERQELEGLSAETLVIYNATLIDSKEHLLPVDGRLHGI